MLRRSFSVPECRGFTLVELLVVIAMLICVAVQSAAAEPAKVDFVRDVRPILEQCVKCHGPEKQQGGLRFDVRTGALREGDSGSQAISPNDAASSELLRRVEATDDSERMPPEGQPLSRDQIHTLRLWIKEGAHWPESTDAAPVERAELRVTAEDRQHWSFQPLHAVQPPTVKDRNWCATTIDQFVLAAMEAKGLRPNLRADRQTLIRRVYFDLIGLPPSPEQVAKFVADARESAYESLVDELLDSPQYGERWGRHWLDLTRYADSDGLESDADRPNAYHYRDFVIRAFNSDISYQTFVRWQLAGDEYEPDDPQALAATGFLTTAPNEVLTPKYIEEERLRLRFNELDDTAVTTTAAFLGLTLGCARCHDHKFDAIPTRDYYRIQAAFIGTKRGDVYLASRDTIAKFQKETQHWKTRMKPLQEQLDNWLTEQKKLPAESLRLGKIDALNINDADKEVLREQPDSEQGKRLSKLHAKLLTLADDDYRGAFTQEQRDHWDALKKTLDQVASLQPASPPTVLAITEADREPQATWLLTRGDFYAKQEPVELGFLSVLTGSRSAVEYLVSARQQAPDVPSSMQRRALAQWMTDEVEGAGALLARVFVNRVWQHHFGEGLCRTVNDFGVRAELPSHPELLDWLARDFVSGDWRLKRLHKLILMSAVYQQDTTFDEARAKVDPENRLLWRRRPLRLESEVLRDAVLAVSGTLNLKQFGPAFKPPIPAEAMLARNTKSPYPLDARDIPATRRRSVYMFHKRVVQHPLMQVFDGPDASASCGRRSNTTVAPQALALLNDPFFRARASDLAKRIIAESGPDRADWIAYGFRLALSRPASDIELHKSLEFLEKQIASRAVRAPSTHQDDLHHQVLTDYCQGLFSLNEFIYID